MDEKINSQQMDGAKDNDNQIDDEQIEQYKAGFTYMVFEKVDVEQNMNRFYYLAWQDTLLGPSVVRRYGRRGGHQRIMSPEPFESLDDAWPLLHEVIKRRLRNGYSVVEPVDFTAEGAESAESEE